MRKPLLYLLTMFAGFLLVLLSGLIISRSLLQSEEYRYSGFLMQRYSILTGIFFLVGGFFAGYFFRLNHWLTGLFMVIWFPLATFYELIVYPGSHNLLGIEVFFHFVFMLPAVIGSYVGAIAWHRRRNRIARKLY